MSEETPFNQAKAFDACEPNHFALSPYYRMQIVCTPEGTGDATNAVIPPMYKIVHTVCWR